MMDSPRFGICLPETCLRRCIGGPTKLQRSRITQICAESRQVFPADASHEARRSRIVQISDSARQLCVNLRDPTSPRLRRTRLRETLREVNGTLKFKWRGAFILLTA